MKSHAALPDGKNLQRMGRVIARLVEQAITQSSAQHDADHTEKKNVFHVLARPRARPGDGSKRRVAQAPHTEEHEQAKSGQIGQAVPVDGQGAYLQGHRIDMGVNQHGGIVPAPCRLPMPLAMRPRAASMHTVGAGVSGAPRTIQRDTPCLENKEKNAGKPSSHRIFQRTAAR